MYVACVLRSGGQYDASWVEKLQRGVARHLKIEHEFVCLTDIKVPSCRTIPLVNDWAGWWSKLELFREGLFDRRVLYIDLDNVVVGSLDEVAACQGSFITAHDWTYSYKQVLNSTVMSWEGDYSFILDRFSASVGKTIRFYDKSIQKDKSPIRRIGDQAYIEDELRDKEVSFYNRQLSDTAIASYRLHNCKTTYPSDAAIISFHGQDKPNTAKADWIKETWI